MKRSRTAVGVTAFLVLAGCTGADFRTFWDSTKTSIDAAKKVPAATGAAAYDIPSLIVANIPGGEAELSEIRASNPLSISSVKAAISTDTATKQNDSSVKASAAEAYYLSKSIEIFDKYYLEPSMWAEAQLRRRQIQDAIIAQSNSLCGEYEQSLNRFDQEGNFLFGSASTLLGGLGAIFTQASAARPLAGSAGIFSGVRSELNADVFQQQAIQVITNGIDSRRKRIAQVMACHVNDSLLNYTLERAVSQAYKYHEACSLIEGLEEAGKVTAQGSDVGLAAAHQTMHAINLIYQDLHPSTGVFSSAALSPSAAASPNVPFTADPTPTCATLLALEDSAEARNAPAASTLATPAYLAQQEYNAAKSNITSFKSALSAPLSQAAALSLSKPISDGLQTLTKASGDVGKELDGALQRYSQALDGYIAANAAPTSEILQDSYLASVASTTDEKAKAQSDLTLALAKAGSEALSAFAMIAVDSSVGISSPAKVPSDSDSQPAAKTTFSNYIADAQKQLFGNGYPTASQLNIFSAKVHDLKFQPSSAKLSPAPNKALVNTAPNPLPKLTFKDANGKAITNSFSVTAGLLFKLAVSGGTPPYRVDLGDRSGRIAQDGSKASVDETDPHKIDVTIASGPKPSPEYYYLVVYDDIYDEPLAVLTAFVKAAPASKTISLGDANGMKALTDPTTVLAGKPFIIAVSGGISPYQTKLLSGSGDVLPPTDRSIADIEPVNGSPKIVVVIDAGAAANTKYVLQTSDASKPALKKSLGLNVGPAVQR